MSNPFAARFREAAFTLEDTNIPEIAEMLHIASREIERLEAALDDRRSPAAAAWKYLDDGVTLLRASLEAIPERCRDGELNQLHDAIKEWLSRPDRAALAPDAKDGSGPDR